MTKETFSSILNAEGITGQQLYEFITQFGKKEKEIEKYLKQYDPTQHAIFNKITRPDRWVFKPTGEKDAQGNTKVDDKNQPLTAPCLEPVTRIAISAQQEITENAAAILCGDKIELVSKTEADITTIEDILEANKLQFKNIRICEIWLSETEVAELWYKNDAGEYKSMILANSDGDTMHPVFDSFGKMIAFGRTYKGMEVDEATRQLKEYTFVEIYTEEQVYTGDNTSGDFVFAAPKPHSFTKMPVSYASRQYPVWWNAQTAIERTEISISNLCDTNDYNGSPILFAEGGVISMAAKGEAGKFVEGEAGSKLQYVTWDQAPESVKMELELLEKIVTNATKFVNLSIQNLKGLFGSAPSSYAIKLLFLPAHMQAAKHEEIFGEFFQRRLNILLDDTKGKPDSITPKFTYLLPKNEQEEVTNINTAKTAGFLSQETSAEISPLTKDPETEVKRLKDEAKAAPVAGAPMEKVA
jgi:hypothetical protein